MPTQVGMGFSQSIDVSAAVYEAMTQTRQQTRKYKIDFVLIFHTNHYHPEEFLPVIRENFKEAKLIGCSAAGIISSNFVGTRGLALLAVSSDDTVFSMGFINNLTNQNAYQSGSLLGRDAIHNFGQHQRKAFVYFGSDLTENNTVLMEGLRGAFGSFFPVMGASVNDYFQTGKSYQYCNDYVLTNGLVGFLLGGRLSLGVGNRHGFKPLGRPRAIDHTHGNTIYLIDGQPAVKIYDDYFGDEARSLRTTARSSISVLYPLGIYFEGEKEYLLRNVLVAQNDGSLLCQGEIPSGSETHLMISNKDACIAATTEAALEAKKQLGDKSPLMILVIASFMRFTFLGREAFKEIQAIKEIFGARIPIMGMYAFGEIFPSQVFTETSVVHLQNGSITIMAIG